jgi:uncharacterized protein YprB with RNaseH-like and TPR domain
MESLSDKLKALGVKLGLDQAQPSETISKAKQADITELLPEGKVISTIHGDTFWVEEVYSGVGMHGRFRVKQSTNFHPMLEMVGADSEFDLETCVFMDTETTGLAGGTGTLAFMVGLGFFRGDDFYLYQGFLRDPTEELAMLTHITGLLEGRNTVVTYNGKSFDVPLMHTRCTINGLEKLFAPMFHIDLLHLARKLWKYRMPSRTLGMVENEILGFHRSAEEVPGWMVPELYFDYQKAGDATVVLPVFYHNAMDILSLGVLLQVTATLLDNPASLDSPGVDTVSVARMAADQGNIEKAVILYEQGLNDDMPTDIYVETLLRFATIYKRDKQWDSACILWEKAAEQGSIWACEELAKYYEHTTKEYQMAIQWVNRGFDCFERMKLGGYQRSRMEQAWQHRLERLLEKWTKQNKS